MNGLGRHEHRELNHEVVLDTREEPASQVIDPVEMEDDIEPSFFFRSGRCRSSSFF